MTDTIGSNWKDLLIAGLGGGAVNEIVESLVKGFLPATAEVAGLSLAQVAVIIGSKYGADRTKDMVSNALLGSAIIGI